MKAWSRSWERSAYLEFAAWAMCRHKAMIASVKEHRSISQGMAAKFYGTANFFENGTFGKIGRAGLNAIKRRQYEGGTAITEDIEKAFEMIEAVVKVRPRRVIHLEPPRVERYIGASDAAYEQGIGSGGFLLAMIDEYRASGVHCSQARWRLC